MNTKPPLESSRIVAAKWSDGFYYLAQTLEQRPNGFTVHFFDGDAGFIGLADLAPLPALPRFVIGDHVMACWKQYRMFPGRVAAVSPTHCRVVWDDGDTPLDVPVNQITYLAWVNLSAAPSAPPPLPRSGEWIDVTSQVLRPVPVPPPLPQNGVNRAGPPPLPAKPSPNRGIAMSIFIPDAIMPVERGERFADPLDNALNAAGVGKIVGEGTFISEKGPYKTIDGCDIQLTVIDVARALPIIRTILRNGGAPPATTITQHDPQRIVHPL